MGRKSKKGTADRYGKISDVLKASKFGEEAEIKLNVDRFGTVDPRNVNYNEVARQIAEGVAPFPEHRMNVDQSGMDEKQIISQNEKNQEMSTVVMPAAVPASYPRGTYRKRYYNNNAGFYKKQYYKLKRYKSRQIASKKKQTAQMKASMKEEDIRAMFGKSWKEANETQRVARNLYNFYGAGDYQGWLRHISSGIGTVAGGAMGYMSGGLTGMASGAQAGYRSGRDFSKFMGWGDYGVSSNQIMGGSNKGQLSVNDDSLTGDVYITQTEFVQNVFCTSLGAGASTFQQTAFPINPGLSNVFPFLSQIAQNYTLYEFEGLIFKFNPTSGENNATSNSLGKVILATQYDPDAPVFINSVQMENYDYANAAKPSQTIFHGVETDNRQQPINMQYVRTGVSSKSKIFTDIGTFYVATEGIPFAAGGTQVLGELWVSYRIKLSRANLYGSLLGQNVSQDVLRGTTSNLQLSTGTTFVKSTNQIGVTVEPKSATAFTVRFPSNISLGSYSVCVRFNTTGGVQTSALPSLGTNVLFWVPGLVLPQVGGTYLDAPSAAAAGNAAIHQLIWVTIQAPGNSSAFFDVNVSAALPAGGTWNLFVSQVNQNQSLALT